MQVVERDTNELKPGALEGQPVAGGSWEFEEQLKVGRNIEGILPIFLHRQNRQTKLNMDLDRIGPIERVNEAQRNHMRNCDVPNEQIQIGRIKYGAI